MGALALATELPSMDLLKQPPNGHEAALINSCMWKHIGIQGIYQVRKVWTGLVPGVVHASVMMHKKQLSLQ